MDILERVLSAECASEIFDKSKNLKSQYRDILRRIHPDVCSDARAKDATEKLISLYEHGTKGEWEYGATIVKNCINGKRYRVNAIKKYDIGVGTEYLMKKSVLMKIEKERYMSRGINEMSSISGFGSLPIIKFEYWGNGVIKIDKGKEIPLREVWNNFHGKIPPKVCAWIVTRLLSYVCGLQIKGLVHCGINIDSVFVDVESHRVFLYGGWWYCVPVSSKMVGTNQDVYRVMSPLSKRDKRARFSTDIESVKALALKLMGCNSRIQSSNVPRPIMEFLRSCSSDSAIEELEKWENALKDGWGTRKFIKVDPKMGEIH